MIPFLLHKSGALHSTVINVIFGMALKFLIKPAGAVRIHNNTYMYMNYAFSIIHL